MQDIRTTSWNYRGAFSTDKYMTVPYRTTFMSSGQISGNLEKDTVKLPTRQLFSGHNSGLQGN